MKLDRDTYLESEEAAYPAGHQTRQGRALFPDGQVRAVWAGIPDTYFSIPAHAVISGRYMAGLLTVATSSDDYVAGRSETLPDPETRWWTFTPRHPERLPKPRRCRSIYPGAVTLLGKPVRCELPDGHFDRHGHSFAARYWDD